MNYYDNEELREHIELLKEKIAVMERLEKESENVIRLQTEQIEILNRIIAYLENWLNNNAPTFDFNALEKFRSN